MYCSETLTQKIHNGDFDHAFRLLYGEDENMVQQNRERYCKAIAEFEKIFGTGRQLALFSAPGRTEVGGNHTDHNHGKVLAASVNMDVIAVVARSEENIVRVQSKGFSMDCVDLNDLAPKISEKNHSAALVRGLCAKIKESGYNLGGFDAYTTSNVLKGSGLSSSAAYEVLVGTIINNLFNEGKISPVTVAQYSQYAENVYFGKASGLLDQLTCSYGGFITVDFKDPSKPIIESISFDFAHAGHALCIIDTRASHSDLSDDYSCIPAEMKAVASFFGKEVLRQVEPEEFYQNIAALRKKVSDRAVLRALHFFNENDRVDKQAQALRKNNFEEFKRHILASGNSSYRYLQNIFTCKHPENQAVGIALSIAEKLLEGKGAWRVHGGGFAGTIQAFVPVQLLTYFKEEMEKVFGSGSCHVLSVRPVGGVQLKERGNA